MGEYYSINILSFVLMMLVQCVDSQSPPVFLVHPVSIAAIDGSTVEFTCTANNTDTILYRVNGTVSTDTTIMAKGFTQLVTSTVDGVTSRSLSVSVSSLYNNTEILCRAIGWSNNVDSSTAVLTVQGPLSSVVNLSHSFIIFSTINISWSPPFTLLGTDISGYNISVTSNSTIMDDFTQDINYELLLTASITNSSNVRIIVTVSAYNGLNGEKASVSFYKPSVPNTIPSTDVVVNEDLRLSLRLNVSGFSIGERPTTADVSLFLGGVTLVDTTKQITLMKDASSSSILTASTPLTVVENEQYTAVVSYENIAGRFNDNSTINFTTFGVQSVTITNTTTDGTVCLECVFSSFSTDSGCTVQLVSTADDNTVQYTETFTRSTSSAGGCITSVTAGQYTVSAYGKGSSVVAVTLTINVTSVPTTSINSEVMSSASVKSFSSDSSTTLVDQLPSKMSEPSVGLYPIVIPTVTIVTIILVVSVVITVVVVYCNIRRRNNTDYHHHSSGDKVIEVDVNPSYEVVIMKPLSNTSDQLITTTDNPSYELLQLHNKEIRKH